ncbi:MAG: AIPR family protein [Acidobacteriota bacterium]
MSRYTTLVTILDQICAEAPPDFKRYHPVETKYEEVGHARSRAFIHLFLKVKFGLTHFKDREQFVTDDPQDGGIDGYYLDFVNRTVHMVQSKFRATEVNFKEKEILFSELLQMDVDRVLRGEATDEQGVPYNAKIKKMQAAIGQTPDIGRWKEEVVILANVPSQVKASQLKKLTGGYPAALYNHNRVYQELVFPVVQGTYYNPTELRLTINLSNISSQSAKITYEVVTKQKKCDITLVFVPTVEIARALYTYRNSILKFNPRSYLELENNRVNQEIALSVTGLKTNEFALFNNGITILSYGTDFNEKIGQKDRGQLIIAQPQIINGGQTAFTLSRLYEQFVIEGQKKEIFEDKEVLLKVITFHPEDQASEDEYLKLIQSISKATNQQSQVNEADRRSNDSIQVQLQQFLYDKYGLFYERKLGEYADGIRAGYIQRTQKVDREIFLRMCKSCDMEPADARRMSVDQLFERQHFEKTLTDPNRFEEYYFAYRCFMALKQIKKDLAKNKTDKFGVRNYGNGPQFGMYAIISACRLQIGAERYESDPRDIVESVLKEWIGFEEYAIGEAHNGNYFKVYADPDTGEEKTDRNFNNYYKGRTLVNDIRAYFAGSRVGKHHS